MRYNEYDEEALRETLVGHSVKSVELSDDLGKVDDYNYTQGKIVLDDGTELLLGGNNGGCSCGSGDYYLTELNEMPINNIMNVEINTEEHGRYGDQKTYRIFVLAMDGRFELATFEGDDGNGYYGTGFWFTVKKA